MIRSTISKIISNMEIIENPSRAQMSVNLLMGSVCYGVEVMHRNRFNHYFICRYWYLPLMLVFRYLPLDDAVISFECSSSGTLK